MAEIGAGLVPTISMVGVSGWTGRLSPFKDETNDGLVSVAEASAEWVSETIRIPAWHTYLPSNKQIAQLILERISQ
jgi:hypothetical protein